MDGIAVIRDITGFDFWIDETGGRSGDSRTSSTRAAT
jgi:hypothetical protein